MDSEVNAKGIHPIGIKDGCTGKGKGTGVRHELASREDVEETRMVQLPE
jgi:hypothetical protein